MTWNHKEDSGNAAPYRSDWVDFFCFFLCVWLLIFALTVAGLRSHDRGQVKGTRGMDTRTHSIHTTLFPTPASSPTSPWVQKPGTRQLFQPSGGRITTGHTVREKQRCRGRKRLRFVYAKRYISYECEAFFHQFHVEFCLETGIVMLCAHCNLREAYFAVSVIWHLDFMFCQHKTVSLFTDRRFSVPLNMFWV